MKNDEVVRRLMHCMFYDAGIDDDDDDAGILDS